MMLDPSADTFRIEHGREPMATVVPASNWGPVSSHIVVSPTIVMMEEPASSTSSG